MPTDDLLTKAISVIVVLVIAGGVLLFVLDLLANKLIGWAFLDGFKKGYRDPPKKTKAKAKVTAQELIERGDAYVKRPALLTEPEKMLFKVLQSKYGDDYHVFAQVRVVDVIRPNTALYEENSREWLALFRQVSQWHFDFVICERESIKVVWVIELDDESHRMKDRSKRDAKINELCRSAGLGLQILEVNKIVEMIEEAAN